MPPTPRTVERIRDKYQRARHEEAPVTISCRCPSTPVGSAGRGERRCVAGTRHFLRSRTFSGKPLPDLPGTRRAETQAQPLQPSTYLVGISVGFSCAHTYSVAGDWAWQVPGSWPPGALGQGSPPPHLWQYWHLSRRQAGTRISGRRASYAVPHLIARCRGLPKWTVTDS